MKKQVSRFPTSDYRLLSEDLHKSDKTTEDMSRLTLEGSTQDFSMDNYDKTQEARKQQIVNSGTEAYEDDDEGSQFDKMDEMDVQVRQSMAGGGDQLFGRNKAQAKLQDFEIRKMIGKGTFGKVFLVEHNKNGKLYAMKCIRKDIIIENEQMENIQLEKDILYTIDHPFLVNMEYVFQNEYRIYFLMHFVKGGELFRHLVNVKRFPED